MIALFWKESRALTATAGVMLVVLLFSLLGLALDARTIGGMPAWLKPAKFAISTAIFAASIAWLFCYLPDFARSKRWVGPALAAILFIENAIIDLQAARGTTSHFNVSTVENGVLFGIMGVSIGVLWLLSVWILVLLFRQKFADPVWGLALRLGMLMSVLGSASGGLMTTPTHEQLAAMKRHEHVTVVGAHTVGAPDGGPGVAGVGWSTQHGDLRIPHFLGLHALQLIPLLVWWRRRQSSARFVWAVAGSYFGLFAILLWQALRGESIVAPSLLALSVLGVWLAASVGALLPLQRNGYTMEPLHER
jgi:hypothetical protein